MNAKQVYVLRTERLLANGVYVRELLGVYSTRAKAERAADRASDYFIKDGKARIDVVGLNEDPCA